MKGKVYDETLKNVTMVFAPSLWDEVAEHAWQHGISKSEFVRMCVEKYIESLEGES